MDHFFNFFKAGHPGTGVRQIENVSLLGGKRQWNTTAGGRNHREEKREDNRETENGIEGSNE